MSEDMEVGERTRDLMDFDHGANKTNEFLKNKNLNPKPSLTLKQKVARGLAAVGIGAAAIGAYKSGVLNTQESESPWQPEKNTPTQIIAETQKK